MRRDHNTFAIDRYFLRRYPGSPNWYAAWFDAGSRQTKRTSLGTADLEAAKVELARLVTLYGEMRDARADTVTIATVFDRYHEHHAKELPSGREQKRHLGFWREFFGDNATVAEVHPARQHAFVERLKGKGYGSGYIKRVLASGAAALRWCYRRGELQSVPHVITVADSEPRERILENDEIKALWAAADHDDELRRYIMILLNTACRPEAARDLSVFQVDLARNRIDLNPPGRTRTTKGRPLIPITTALRAWLAVDRERVVGHGEKWLSVKWRAARDRAGLDGDVVPYTIRHTIATALDEADCPENEIAAFMGWKFSNRMRGWYTKRRAYRPDYCANVVAALDGWMADLGLQSETARSDHRAASYPVNLALRARNVQAKVATGGKTLELPGAGEGIRTLDPNLGKVVLYP